MALSLPVSPGAGTDVRPAPAGGPGGPIVGERVELQLFTTLKCNLRCRYCVEADGGVRGSQGKVSYTLDQLEDFVRTHLRDREVFVTFYGGEPLLNVEFISAVMERFPLWRCQLQTNGTLLDRVPDGVLSQFRNILVSIDGRERVTDSLRGAGVHRRILGNLSDRRGAIRGALTARVTWTHSDTEADDFDSLLETFDFVYFQFPHTDWVYGPEHVARARAVLDDLVDRFFTCPGIYRVIPIMGAVRNKLFPSRARELYGGLTQCRVSSHLLNVLPDGRIVGCPDFAYHQDMCHGSVVENRLSRNPLQRYPSMPCESCRAFPYCRTNCIMGLYRAYVLRDDAYREKVVDPVCGLIRHLGESIDRHDRLAWYRRLPLEARRLLTDCEVYEYVEIAP